MSTHMDRVQGQCIRQRDDRANMTTQLAEGVRHLAGTTEGLEKVASQTTEMVADMVAAENNNQKREESAQMHATQVNTAYGTEFEAICAEAEAYRDTYNVEGPANTEYAGAAQMPDDEESCIFARLKNPLTQMDEKTIKAYRPRYGTQYKATRPQSYESQQAARAIARTGIN